ncbi:DUF3267 domain-containing protein [Oceanirhabdus seepicola]|uniref:DUF3267 domain-containing protein n=1 Tax=Oceanirhabdus seepicola TaxID=2828781 RepID=A0A9J6P676_9CLOT|nr:DUF3267 domain-containing protein [Oceanirhabdus seepicola]MCM1991617.1 DUF3267 domain-containing protein [Oceanirhabdus seepicola]
MKKKELDNSFKVVDKTFSMAKANVISIFIILPIYITLSIVYNEVCGYEKTSPFNFIMIGILVVAGLVLHEFLHGFVWQLFCERKWKSINFGFNIKTFSPYAHCKEVLPINQYRLGTIAPAIFTGVIPFIFALIFKNNVLATASILLICVACGDFMILYTIAKEKSTSLVIDHPTMCGCQVYRKKIKIS